MNAVDTNVYVYAFDADSNGGEGLGLLWHTSLGTSAVTPNSDFGNRYGPYHDIDPEVGITSTPVIDPTSIFLQVAPPSSETWMRPSSLPA